MFILRLLRYLQGTVRFRAQGVFVERFLNLLARDRIPVWDGRKRGDAYEGHVRAGSYRRMRRHAKKAGIKLSVVDKAGLPFQRRKYRKRRGLLVGLLLFGVFLAVMSGFIWRVEVGGNEKVEDSEVIAALERIGVKPGAWRSSINVRECERMAMLQLREISWIALNIEGSTVHVELSESMPPPPMIDPDIPCNVVAGATGQIVKLQVFAGQALLREGDTVMAGDIIVSGIKEDRLGQNLFRHALASVRARVEPELTVEVPLAQTEYRQTGDTRTRRYIQSLGFDLPFFLPRGIPAPYRVERSSQPVTVLGAEMPVSIFREDYILMEEVPVTCTEEQAKQLALTELAALEKARLGDADILQKSMTAKVEKGVFVLTANYTCIMEIGMEKEIFQEAQ